MQSMFQLMKTVADQKKDEKHIVVPALRRTPSGVSMEYKCIIIARYSKKRLEDVPEQFQLLVHKVREVKNIKNLVEGQH